MRPLAPGLALATCLALAPVPAHAANPGDSLAHVNDPGYDSPIWVACDPDPETHIYTMRRIREGQHSDDKCVDRDVDQVWVGEGERLKFRRPDGTWRVIKREGWRVVSGQDVHLKAVKVLAPGYSAPDSKPMIEAAR